MKQVDGKRVRTQRHSAKDSAAASEQEVAKSSQPDLAHQVAHHSTATKTTGFSSGTMLLPWLVFILGVVTTALYIIGALYANGYINELGLQSHLYARPPDQYIFLSTQVFSIFSVSLFDAIREWASNVVLVVSVFILAVAIAIVCRRWTRLRLKLKALFAFLKKLFEKLMGTPLFRVAFYSTGIGFIVFYVPLAVAFLFALSLAPFESAGASAARDRIDNFLANGGCESNKEEKNSRRPICATFTSKDIAQRIKGFILLSSDKAITIYDVDTNRIKTFFPKDGLMIEGKLRPPSLAKS
jgi:hypothetical protein